MTNTNTNKERLYDVIKGAIITEKSMMATVNNTYTFEVKAQTESAAQPETVQEPAEQPVVLEHPPARHHLRTAKRAGEKRQNLRG